ncbi:hypothetical protein L1I30_01160 [Gillisia sp. M10.2A]|uniref:HTH luxR-type domain-containing protein n=1 Tax=Gillisia lutea TaxID=2909668 RepID=A0ABS9EBN0_9FLAO|nr:triple tyrosine motif-containing protein [Gillisia lutea]MCF4100262.1 hypothetical protein [Gillisia lutea]
MFRILVLLLLFTFSAQAQEIAPYFKNYTKLDYNGENSNWDIAQHNDGTMYVANGKNLLSFNGDFWKKYELPKPSTIRSVNVINDTIYTGAYRQFGYWVKNDKNELSYTSLSDKLDEQYFKSDEIWKIIAHKDRIYFQSFSNFFIYNTSSKKIQVVPFGNISAVYSFLINDRFYITSKNHGLYILKGNKIEFLNWSAPLQNFTIQSVVSLKNNLLIATQLNGMFLYDGKNLKPWSSALQYKFESLEINNLQILDKFICVGTINNGLLVFDETGNFKYAYNKKNGLANNTVLRQYIDKNDNLWLALDNGLSKVFLSNNVYEFNDPSGALGTVYAILEDDKSLVLGSNHGVFYLDGEELEFLKNSNGQVWDLAHVEGEIICGHNNGTFSIKNNQFRFINDINGGMDFKPIPKTDFYIQPNYTGVARYKKVNGKWEFKRYKEIDFPVSSLEFDAAGNLWLETAHRGIFQFAFTPDHHQIKQLRNFKTGSSEDKLFALGKEIFIANKDRILKYDIINDTLIQDAILEVKLKPFNKLTAIGDDMLVLEKEEALKIANVDNSFTFTLNDNLTNSRLVKNYPNTTSIGDHIFVFLDDGFLKINEAAAKDSQQVERVYIEAVLINGEQVSISNSPKVPFRKNFIQFSFSSKTPGNISLPQYSYKLEGYDKEWSVPSRLSQVSYSNLPSGDFKFKVRSGVDQSEAAIFNFSILKPWYLSVWAAIGYVFLLVLVIVLIYYYNKFKFIRKRKHLEKELEYEQRLILQKQNFENQRRIDELEQDKLKSKLKSKSKELASYAALMARKEDILTEMEQEINKSNIKKENVKLYSKLMDIKDRQSNSQDEWKLFERNFNEVHEDFFRLLQKGYPDLTPKDLKLCAYLRMNLSSKEIAPLIGITFRSVELHRYRLRKKFHLSKNQNLVKFLLKVK